MGVVGAAVLSLLVVQYHVPFGSGWWSPWSWDWPSEPSSTWPSSVGCASRPRRRARRHHRRLATGLGDRHQDPPPTRITTHFPSAINGTWTVAGVTVRGSDLSILIIVPITLIALTWFLDRTTLGRTVKACSTNPRLARLSGISPKMVSTLVWALAAALSTLSVVLIAGQSGAAGDLTTLGPQTLSLALVAAVIGGMTSFSRTIVAAVAIGVLQSIVNFNYIDKPGLINLLLLIIVVVAVLFNRERTDESEVFAFTPRAPDPVRLQASRWARNINKSGIFFLGAIAIVLPLIFTQPSTQQTFTEILAFAICATSLTVLTGWLGQLSPRPDGLRRSRGAVCRPSGRGGRALLARHRRDHGRLGCPRHDPRAQLVAGQRPLPGRRHVRVRPGGAAVFLQPRDPERGLDRRGQPAVRTGQALRRCPSRASARTTTWCWSFWPSCS